MNKQFTASEVRDCTAYFYGDKLTRISAMLTAYADLLEAQEKAVPAGWAKDFSEQRETIVSWSKDAPEFGKGGWWPLYTHPSADENTKRLQFIEEHPGWLRYSQPHGKHKNGWCCANPLTNYEYEMFATATEAIDAARAKEPQSRKIAEAARICREVEEAREKAVPIYQLMATDDSWWDVSRELYEAEGSHAGRTRILYTHPAPSDAERLAEALRDCIRDLFIAAEYSKTMRNPNALLETANRAEKALAAYSAQAQPPAQSKYAPPYPDQAQDPFWKVPGMVDTRPKAQPPADTERLAELLRGLEIGPMAATLSPKKLFAIGAAIAAQAKEAQPPADSERLEELGRILRSAMIQGDARVIGKNELNHALEILAAHSDQTQPPAASVTDTMVDAALTRAVIASKKSGIKGPTRYMMRAALEAALAAQENPNG